MLHKKQTGGKRAEYCGENKRMVDCAGSNAGLAVCLAALFDGIADRQNPVLLGVGYFEGFVQAVRFVKLIAVMRCYGGDTGIA